MIPTAPEGITVRLVGSGIDLGLPTDDFVLQAGEQRQLLVVIEVASYVAPDTYPVMISAEGWDAGTGLTLLGSAAEQASVTVIGEGATVVLDTAAPGGEPVVGTIRLFRVVDGVSFECAYSTSGHLEAGVAPGHYLVWAEMNGTKQEDTEQEFDLVANEQKSLTLTIEIIYFEAFAVNPAYHPQTNELGYVQITYTVNNVYQQVDSAEVRLVVTLNGAQLEEIPGILSVSPLNVGRIGMPYEYTPAWGWEDGIYGFSLRLLINGEQYASTNEQTLDVDVPGGSSSLLFIILGIIGGGLLLGIIVFVVARRRKRGERPEKAAKKKAKVKVDKKAKARGEAPAPAPPTPGVDILFGRQTPQPTDQESVQGLTRPAAAAPPKEAAKTPAPSAAPAPPKPSVEKPAAPKPAEATTAARETVQPKKEVPAPGPTPPPAAAPRPAQPPSGVKPAEAKPVQPAAPKTTETPKPAPGVGAARPFTPPATPKAAEPTVSKPAPEPAKPSVEPAKPSVEPVKTPPETPKAPEPPVRPPVEPVKPPPAQPAMPQAPAPAAARPPAEEPSEAPPAEKPAAKPDLRLVSALEQRMSRVRKETPPDSAKAPADGTRPDSVSRPASPPEPPAHDKPSVDQTTASEAEPPAHKPADESQQPADEQHRPQPEKKDQPQKDDDEDDGGTDKKFTSPIRFFNK